MIDSAVVSQVYLGDGETTQFPIPFPFSDADDVKCSIYDIQTETETDLTDDYFVDTVAGKVIYPGYPPGEEPQESEQPPVLPSTQKLVVYRATPITQLEDLGEKYPLPIVEGMVDKNTMILQEMNEITSRAVVVERGSEYTPQDVSSDIRHLKEYRDDAMSAAANAANSATSASGSATESANSATEAAESAANAAASALQAAQAGAAEATRIVGEVMPQIMIASTNAGNYADAAQASATQAALSASTAATQANIATSAADDAADSADDAADSAGAAAVSAGAAATSAAEAETANTEAKYYAKITMDKIAESAVGYPSQVGTLTYDGTEQEPTWDVFYEPQKMTVTGTTAATDAGTYTITMTPKPTYYWWDTDTTTARTQTWTIGRQAISTVPSQSGAVVYDGTEQSPTWADYDSTKLTIGGTTAATEAGTYTATFTPTANYKWSDESTTAKSVTWTISPAELSVPTVTDTTKTYNGSPQSPTIGTYDPALIEVSGDTETNAGSYAVTFHLKSASTVWSDTSTADKSVAWSIAKASVTAPTVSDASKTYDGTVQAPTISTYDPTEIVVSGDTSAINAGSYTIYFSLASANYKWSDESTGVKTASWSISPKSVTVPTLSNTSKTYNGTTQSPTISPFDATEITQTGDISAINAGTYTVYWSLASQTNYVWSDTTTGTKFDTWTIAKAAGSLSISPSSITLDTSTLSDTIAVTRAGDGAISAVSSDTSIATVSVSGTTVTVTAVASGSVTVTVSVAAGTNYLAPTDATASVAVSLMPPVGLPLNDYSWEDISKIAQAGVGEDYFDIGDVKMITLNGKIGANLTLSNQSLGVFILGFNHKDNNVAENNIIFGGFKSALSGGKDVALIDIDGYPTKTDGTKCFNFNHWGNYNYGGWKGSDLRYDILGATSTQPSGYGAAKQTSCIGYDATAATLTSPKADTFLAALPSDLRSVIRLRTHYVDNTGKVSNVDANITAVVDAVSLLAEFEIFGTRSYANQYEKNHQAQMKYYANGNAKVKYKHNSTSTAVFWWECSPHGGSGNSFCSVGENGGGNDINAYYALGLAPAFKV